MWHGIFEKIRYSAVAVLMALLCLPGVAPAAEYWLRAEATSLTLPGGASVPMWGYALTDSSFTGGTVQVPGPRLTVPPGEPLIIHLQNNLPEPTSIVIPGQVPDSMAPVRFADGPLAGRIRSFAPEAAPGGGEQTYAWSTIKAGTFLYQSGSHPGIQVPMGLYGAMTAEAAADEAYPGVLFDSEAILLYSEVDPDQHAAVAGGTYGSADYPGTLVVGYHPRYFLINGVPYSQAAPPTAIPVRGTALLRFLNAGLRGRVPVLLGNHLQIIAEDGNLKPFRPEQSSIDLPPGMTIDALLQPVAPGRIPLYDRALGLSNAGAAGGGMVVFLDSTIDVILRQPNGGEVLNSGDVYPIRWSPVAGAATFGLDYSLDNGATWTAIGEVGAVTSFDWTVPAVTAPEADSLVRVTAYDAAFAQLSADTSDAPFTILPPFQLLTPNGGERLVAGTVHTIEWFADDAAAGYGLDYSLDGGANWIPIGQVGAVTGFDWTVPAVTGVQGNSLVRVTSLDSAGGTISVDASDAAFTITPPVAELIEFGQISVGSGWQTVVLQQTFVNPVVIAKPLSKNGWDPATVRIRNVTPTGFEIRVQEWDYLDGNHIPETLTYLVVEAGRHQFPGGAAFEAGFLATTESGPNFRPITFLQPFAAVPVVLTSVLTANDPPAVVTRNRSVTTAGFQVRMQEQEAADHIHGEETLGYVAFEPMTETLDGVTCQVGTFPGVTHTWATLNFGPFTAAPAFVADMQTVNGADPANLRLRNRTAASLELQVQEEQSLDAETTHWFGENVGYILFGN